MAFPSPSSPFTGKLRLLLGLGAALLNGALWIVGGTPVDGDFGRTSAAWSRIDLATGEVRTEPTGGPPFTNPLLLVLRGELHVSP